LTIPWPARCEGFRIAHHPCLGSTQDTARALAEAGERELVVVADVQTGGHGRHGRGWVSPAGNLYASLVTRPPFARALWPVGSLIAATSLAAALADVADAPLPVAVKWPNDVLLDGRKIAGLLLEVVGDVLVVGCGLNVTTSPAALPEATALACAGVDAAPPTVLEAWLRRWRAATAALAAGDTAGWRERWLELAAGLHRPIRVTLADRVIEGVHRGIDGHGALRVETPSGVEAVLAGDVELVRSKETF